MTLPGAWPSLAPTEMYVAQVIRTTLLKPASLGAVKRRRCR